MVCVVCGVMHLVSVWGHCVGIRGAQVHIGVLVHSCCQVFDPEGQMVFDRRGAKMPIMPLGSLFLLLLDIFTCSAINRF